MSAEAEIGSPLPFLLSMPRTISRRMTATKQMPIKRKVKVTSQQLLLLSCIVESNSSWPHRPLHAISTLEKGKYPSALSAFNLTSLLFALLPVLYMKKAIQMCISSYIKKTLGLTSYVTESKHTKQFITEQQTNKERQHASREAMQ